MQGRTLVGRRFGHLLLLALILSGSIGGVASVSTAQAVSDSCPCTLFPDTATPSTANWPDANAVELGVKFFADSPGYVYGIRIYKGSSNTGTHIANLWTAGGQLLATGTFSNESASGWQSTTFSAPVAVQANTVYVASYHTAVGFYSADPNYFAQQHDAGPLHALGGVNGVFAYGASGFPNQTYNQTNYWVDLSYDPALTTTTHSSSVNPSVFGRSGAAVSPNRPAPGASAGTVTFYDRSRQIGSVALDSGNDRASFSIATLSVGSHTLSAVYAGAERVRRVDRGAHSAGEPHTDGADGRAHGAGTGPDAPVSAQSQRHADTG